MRININSILYVTIALLINVFIFISYYINVTLPLAILICIVLLISKIILKDFKCYIYRVDKWWIAIVCLMMGLLIISPDKKVSLTYTIGFTCMVVIKILIGNNNAIFTYIKNISLFFSSIFVATTLLYIKFPNFIQAICRKILTSSQLNYNLKLYRDGANCGITGDPALNSLYITIFIAIIFSNIIIGNKNKMLNYFLLACGLLSLFLTGKRGPLLANIIAIIFVIFLSAIKDKRKILIYLVSIIVIIGIGYLGIKIIPQAEIVFKRFNTSNSEVTLLNGREEIYYHMKESIKQHPIIGIGPRSAIKVIGGNDGHNIYLQIITEYGFVGGIVIFIALILSLLTTIKMYGININKAKKNEVSTKLICQGLFYQVFFLVYGMSGNPFYNFYSLMMYFVVLGYLSFDAMEVRYENRNINL